VLTGWTEEAGVDDFSGRSRPEPALAALQMALAGLVRNEKQRPCEDEAGGGSESPSGPLAGDVEEASGACNRRLPVAASPGPGFWTLTGPLAGIARALDRARLCRTGRHRRVRSPLYRRGSYKVARNDHQTLDRVRSRQRPQMPSGYIPCQRCVHGEV
jgi:hypothetical protein